MDFMTAKTANSRCLDWTSRRETRPQSARFLLPRAKVGFGSELESELVEQYVPLVRNIVARLAMSLPSHVDNDDLFSAGLTGLLDALRHFDPRAGSAFESYARVRIRGAIFDELRRMDWVPRSVHAKARKVQAVRQQLEQARSRPPTDAEMAGALKLSLPEYRQWLQDIRPATFICLDGAAGSDPADNVPQYESLPDHRQENPLEGTVRRELADVIAAHLEQLPEIQRKVLALYYYEDLRLREIAEIFGLTESRICQIHAQAILNIKTRLERFEPAFARALN